MKFPGKCNLFASVALSAFVFCGCRTADKKETAAEIVKKINKVGEEQVRAKKYDESPIITSDIALARGAGIEEQESLPERKSIESTKPTSKEYPSRLIKGMPDPDAMIKVEMNLDATPLADVIAAFGAESILNFDYMIDPSVNGAVTFTVNTEVKAKEVWEMFEHILWLSGAYASENPGFIHIMPFNKMPQERRIFAQHDPQANVEVAIIPIYNTKSSELIGNIKPFMTGGSTVTDLPRQNSLLIIEAPPNMKKIHELIKRLDDKGEASWPHSSVRCHNIDSEQIVAELEALLPVIGFPTSPGNAPSGGQVKMTAIPRLQVIVVSAALPEVLEEVKKWIHLLDKEDQAEQENFFFYNIENSTSERLSEAMDVFFNTSTTASSKTTRSTVSSIGGRATNTSAPSPTSRRSRTTRNTEETEGDTIFDTPVIIYADAVLNRLVIKTTPRAWAVVEKFLERLDMPTRQVLIEAVIADIKLTENTQFGFAYAMKNGASQYGVDLSPNDAVTNVTDISSMIGNAYDGISMFKSKNEKIHFINAVAGKNNVTVLSAPQILAATDEQASINVGEQVSIRTTQYNSSATNPQTNYEYKETGTILTVTPHITAGHKVRVEIEQEVSSFQRRQDEGSDSDTAPDIANTVLNTVLEIPDGGTVMMGGLINSKVEDGHSGLPFIKDIPVLGHLFRSHSNNKERKELLVMITVNVVDTEQGTDHLVNRFQAALKAINEQIKQVREED